ncbi:MAG: hypothetical protein ACNI3A_07015 [Desulfovibrio sp.]|uniref:hypothetical protein n=1 Tax=Desulfovibrio sp. 7SRBS1 TaxID=3378064 RepID=UPI003B3EB4FC
MTQNYTADELGKLMSDFYGYLKDNDSVNLQYKKKFLEILKGYSAFERRYLLTLYYTIYLEGQLQDDRINAPRSEADVVN